MLQPSFNTRTGISSRWTKVLRAALALLFWVAVGFGRARAQLPQVPTPGSSVTQSDATPTNSGTNYGVAATPSSNTANGSNSAYGVGNPSSSNSPYGGAGGSNGVGLAAGLPASQIISILQQRPEVVVELKSMVADWMQRQGAEVPADEITDEMLYSQIAGSADLRSSITTFLRARGYVSDDSLQGLAGSVEDSGGGDNSLPRQGTGMMPGDLAARDSAALARVYGVDGNGLGAANSPVGRSATATGRVGTSAVGPRDPNVSASTDVPKVLRSPAPYNLQSMRDLYTQIPEQTAPLKRFGSEVFVNRDSFATMLSGSGRDIARDTPLDVPLGPDYVVGPGDTLGITVWGGVTQTITRTIDRDGRILLPEGGQIDLAGLSLERVQKLLEGVLKPQYRNAQIAVTVSQLRSVRVYLVGDVQRPGGFDISALATPLSALYTAGGPTAAGSLRVLKHYRGEQLVDEIDLYDFLLHGLRHESVRFQSGDTLMVPPAGPQIAIFGAVKRPAIYELKNGELKSGESTLASVAEDAGGFTVAASLSHITVERVDANRQRVTVTFDPTSEHGEQAAIAAFAVKDGDRIRIAPVLPYSERAVYVEGHVVRPGRQPYRDGMRLSDVLKSYQDMLPEPAARGEIVRLVPPDLHAETIAFDVPEVLIGNANNELRPFDTIRIFGRYEMDAPKVEIHGEVLRPGTFPLSKGMTAAQLVRMAGGFKNSALRDNADLTSYTITGGTKVVGTRASIRIGDAVSGVDAGADVPLKPGDVLTIHEITGWKDIGQSVTIEGQVAFPGNYGFVDGERLSSVLQRAGGLRESAYPAGAVLVRGQVRELEEKSRQELIRQIETSSAAARLQPNLGGADSAQTLQLIQAQQDQVLTRLKSEPPSGRLVVHITADIASWANTSADIELRRGDVLTIPKGPSFVLVTGQVYNATALTFTPGKTAGWYLQHAGGTNSTANRKEIFVIRANGSVIGRHSGGAFDPKVLDTKLDPGDVVVVPQKVVGSSLFWRNLLTAAQLASSIAITAAVASL